MKKIDIYDGIKSLIIKDLLWPKQFLHKKNQSDSEVCLVPAKEGYRIEIKEDLSVEYIKDGDL